MPVVYTAVQRFNPACGERWQGFVEWSGLKHLREVVSMDHLLCPTGLGELTDDDWQHNVQEDFKLTLFHNLDHVLRRVTMDEQVNILALFQNPTEDEVHSFHDDRFALRGFDLVELQSGISALVNCGGFDRAFAPTELSDFGLLADHARALVVQNRLRAEYPDEPHADCDLWAVWQMQVPPATGGEGP